MGESSIEWLARPGTKPESWNMVGGCQKTSPGCDHCYALRDSWRIMHNPRHPARYNHVAALDAGNGQPAWTGIIHLDWAALDAPERWYKPRTVFVASMSDFFHVGVSAEFTTQALDTMNRFDAHTYLLLTKRHLRMQAAINTWLEHRATYMLPRHMWAGVTTENQVYAEFRIPSLMHIPASIRYLSVEPMLGPVDIYRWLGNKLINWVIIGAESGVGARICKLDWVYDLVAQCGLAGIPVFIKQLHINGQLTKDPADWPQDLRLRHWPGVFPYIGIG